MGDVSVHFSRSEFACPCGCGLDAVDAVLLKELQRLRHYFARPIYIRSGCRCKKHNTAVGGSQDSQHLLCKAADIVVDSLPAVEVQQTIEQWHLGRYGIGRYPFHTHIDVRDKPARWQSGG